MRDKLHYVSLEQVKWTEQAGELTTGPSWNMQLPVGPAHLGFKNIWDKSYRKQWTREKVNFYLGERE